MSAARFRMISWGGGGRHTQARPAPCPQPTDPPGGTVPAPSTWPCWATRRGTPPSLGPDCDRTYFLMGKEPPSGEHFNTPSVPPAPTAQRPLRDARGQGSTEGTGFGVRGTGPRPEGSPPESLFPRDPRAPAAPVCPPLNPLDGP